MRALSSRNALSFDGCDAAAQRDKQQELRH
jgi:hypothetical protein